MGRICFYSYGGSGNHGCEAIARSLKSLLDEEVFLYSASPGEEKCYQMDQIFRIHPDREPLQVQEGISRVLYWLAYRIDGKHRVYYRNIFCDFLREVREGDLYLSIGGDNYCYGDSLWLSYLNQEIQRRKAKTALVGCSIGEGDLDRQVLRDLSRYSCIVARESETCELLQERISKEKVFLCPDPAFALPSIVRKLPEGCEGKEWIGMNISPLILRKNPKILENYQYLVEEILSNTGCQILLVPHVVWPHNDDRIPLKLLWAQFQERGRIQILEDGNAMELKGDLSRCSFFVGARTHATIAAYSSCVPTLAVGYSIKARGIARDLFGTDAGYVLPIEEMTDRKKLAEAFWKLYERRQEIRDHLKIFMPEYIARTAEIPKKLREVCYGEGEGVDHRPMLQRGEVSACQYGEYPGTDLSAH